MHYKLSPRQIARCRCNDCGVNVIEAGDYCMLRPRIWRDTFGLGITDNLCLACIEKRLGRAITVGDVMTSRSSTATRCRTRCMRGSSHPRSGAGRGPARRSRKALDDRAARDDRARPDLLGAVATRG